MADASYRIVVADDSALYRHVLPKVLNANPHLEVVAVAADGQQAVDLVDQHRPDGVVLDLNMPNLNGFDALERILQDHALPVVMISAGAAEDGQLAVQAVSRGAIDLFVKPLASSSVPLSQGLRRLSDLMHAACHGRSLHRAPSSASAKPSSMPAPSACDLIAVGASTGGIAALATIISNLDERTPPLIVAQHMPRGFTATLGYQLAHTCRLTVAESEPGMMLKPGSLILCATDDTHTVVRRARDGYRLDRNDGPKEHHQRPAIDPLFRSVADSAGARALGILLTGMGRDGAAGLLAMRNAGAQTIAESDATAVVFGMPRAAIEIGAAARTLALDQIQQELSARRAVVPSRALMEPSL